MRQFASQPESISFQLNRLLPYAWVMSKSVKRPAAVAVSLRLRSECPPPNYAFKPTAGEVCRSNPPLPAGGGLTRRYTSRAEWEWWARDL